MAYRRRRSRGTWLPTQGTALGEGGEAYLSGFQFGGSVPDTKGDIETNIYPITTDAPFEGDDVTSFTTMGSVIGNEYFLDRIVGKCFLNYAPGLDNTGAVVSCPVLVCCGFFVARADDANKDIPVGSATSDERRDNYNPLELDTIREPWIWRRSWILGSAGNARSGGGMAGSPTPGNWYMGAYPSSNTLCGSVADGPHIDAKTKRRVGQDDRLFFAIGIWNTELGGQGIITTPPIIQGYLDFRLHGALRRARPGGKF